MTKLPLTVSSKLTNLDVAGAAVQLTAYANETQSAEKAPVLLAVQSAMHVDADKFANLLVQEGGQGTAAQARLAVNAIASALAGLIDKYGAITVQTPFGTVQTFVAGTVEEAHSQPDPETNFPFLAVVVPEAYRKLFAKYETYIPAEACPVTLRRVRDKATNAKGICGTQPFYLEGSGMTFGGEGETLELLDPLTRDKLCDIAVDAESKSPVQFLCTLSPQTAIEAGKYLLRLTTLAGGDTTLWPVDLTVELVEAVPAPPPTVRIDKVVSQDGTEDVINFFGGVAHVEGENLALLPGDTVKLRGKLASTGEDDEHLFDDFAYDAETGKIDITVGDGELSFAGSTWNLGLGADVVVTSRGGVAGSEPQVVTRHVTLAGA